DQVHEQVEGAGLDLPAPPADDHLPQRGANFTAAEAHARSGHTGKGHHLSINLRVGRYVSLTADRNIWCLPAVRKHGGSRQRAAHSMPRSKRVLIWGTWNSAATWPNAL